MKTILQIFNLISSLPFFILGFIWMFISDGFYNGCIHNTKFKEYLGLHKD